MKKRILDYLPHFFIFLFFVFSFFYITFLSKDNAISVDDFMECTLRLNESFFDSLTFIETENGGGYLCIFFTKVLTFWLPYFFNIHPADFNCNIAPIIKGFLFSLFFFISAQTFFIRNRNNWLFLSLFSFLIFYIFFLLTFSNFMCISNNITFFRYVISVLFYFILFSYIYKNIIWGSKRISFFECFLLPFSVLAVATNLETIIFSFCIFFILIIVYNLFVELLSFLKKIKYLKKIYKFNLNIKFYISVFLFYLFVFFYLNSNRFHNNFDWRGLGSFKVSLSDILEYFNLFFQLYILDNVIYWSLFSFLIIIFLYVRRNTLQFKKLFCLLFMVFSIILVYLSLFNFGKNNYFQNYWIADEKIVLFFKIMILSPFFILLDDLLSKFSNKCRKITISIVTCCLFMFSFYYMFLIFSNINFLQYPFNFKKVNYINEKMYRYYKLQNKVPYLLKIIPYPYDSNWVALPFLEILTGINNYNEVKLICNSEPTRTSGYLKRIYPDDNDVYFCLTDDALDIFFNNGGSFSKNELENISFSKLRDSEFVLNTATLDKDKMSKDEIIDIYKKKN